MISEVAGDPTPAPRAVGPDSPVMLVLLTRAVQLAAAPVTLWMIATRRPLAEQGLYFILWNAQALTQLLELGVGNLLVHIAGHESVRLTLTQGGSVTGDEGARGRLLGALADAQRWYSRFASWFLVLAGAGGALIFQPAARDDAGAFVIPWVITVGFVAAYFMLIPRLCTIEGSGGLIPVQRMRLAQVTAASVLHWFVLWHWGALWAVAAFAVTHFVVARSWLRTRYPLLAPGDVTASGEFAGVQRRSAITWLALWAGPQVITPVVLLTQGAAAAGQVGMSLAIAMAPTVLAGALLQARYPRYAPELSRAGGDALRSLARAATIQATVLALSVLAAAAIAVALLPRFVPQLAERMLGPTALVLLGVTSLAWLLTQSYSSYLRAWRREPLTGVILASVAIVSIASLVSATRLPLDATVAAHAAIVPVVLVTLLAAWYSLDRRRAVPENPR